jgi:hypothetical protein
VVLGAVAHRFARSEFGWPVAVALATFSSPRLFMYQASSMQAAVRGPAKTIDQPHSDG